VVDAGVGLGGGLFELIQVHHHHVDGANGVFGQGGAVRGHRAARQDAGRHARVNGLHPAIEHFGETGDFADILDGEAGVAQQPRGATGGDQFPAELAEAAGEIRQSGFICDAEQGTFRIRHI
jgi:hypothetical protein